MSKFCTSCGAQLADDAVFCTTCGAQQSAGNQQSTPNQGGQAMNNFTQAAGNFAQNASDTVKQTFDGVTFDSVKDSMTIDNIKNVGKTKNKNTIIGLCAAAAVIIILVIILCVALGGGGYKDPIDNYVKAVTKTDGKAMEKALPKAMNEYIEDEVVDEDEYDNLEEFYEEILYDSLDSLEDEYGDNIKMKYKIIKKKEIKDSDLDDIEDYINDNYDADVKVTKGYEVKVKMTIKGSDDDDTDTNWINVYKIDGDWCFASRGMF